MNRNGASDLPTWDLSDLYSGIDDPQIEADLSRAEQRAVAFEERYRGQIGRSDLTAARMREAMSEYEALLQAMQKPAEYAQLLFSTDTTDAARGKLLQRARESASAASTHLIFFDIEIGRIPNETFERVIHDPILDPYRHYIEHERALAAHRLDEAEEKILEETANTRGRAFGRLFTEVTSRQTFRVGDEELTQSELLARFHHPDRDVRRSAAESLTTTLRDDAHVLNFIFNTLLHDKQIVDRLRRFDSPEASRHLDNEIDERVVETVVEVCVRNYDVVSEYYALKRALLGLDELMHYDRYAPIPGADVTISFGDAKNVVLDGFGRFSPELATIAERFFTRRWIDAALAPGKQGGAFCSAATPDIHPFVLMNYTGKPRDVMTLAHELGHGVHDVLASGQNFLNYHPVLPMAETASTFGEMLVFEELLKRLSSPREKLALLCSKIEDSFATVFRQIAMYRFEQQAHRLRREQGEQPAETYSSVWQSVMQEMFGDALTLGEEHRWWWLYIPHVFRVPFYVYAYAFGELLVLSLYAQYRREGEAFVPRYVDLLSAGGSARPAELVGRMGFDIASRAFWQGGCDLIRRRVKDAKALAEEIGLV